MREAPHMTITYAEQSSPVRTSSGRDVTARRERIGMKIYELAEQANVSPDTLSDWERGIRNPHSKTVEAVLDALDRLEEEMGITGPVSTEAKPGMVRFEVTGVYGADALVVEGPIESIAELEAAIDRIMRGSQRRNDEGSE
jgi:transcriptional regulator with XRE-family HTH domain